MATIKQIEDRTVHQIQSGQVIVDLCSVVKELVENSVDAGATSIDVRFKNQGLDLIEVQDNGSGISPANYPSVALKHHTSKLSSYSDIALLQTFGFRGEALASLCALSTLTVTTCQASEVPKGSKLSFETSGKLKGTAVVAAQKGTTVSIEKLFYSLPVRRRELERNIKREWNKVISLLNQYACIQTNLKFTVSQQPNKGKRILLFSTKGNATTRDNVINIFGAKTMSALVPLDLSLEMQPTGGGVQSIINPRSGSKDVRIIGHVSRPTHGDGRQTPDRQMFFVNGRPCGLPQFAKAFNEVYRSYNSSQNPFIMADIQLDTDMYDVNVSPDKRSILLHDQNHLLDTLRESLTALFDAQDYTVPTSRLMSFKKTPSRSEAPESQASRHSAGKPTIKSLSQEEEGQEEEEEDETSSHQFPKGRAMTISSRTRSVSKDTRGQNLISRWVESKSDSRTGKAGDRTASSKEASSGDPASEEEEEEEEEEEKDQDETAIKQPRTAREVVAAETVDDGKPRPVQDFNARLRELGGDFGNTLRGLPSSLSSSSDIVPENEEPTIPAVKVVKQQGAVDYKSRSPIRRSVVDTATVVIGSESITGSLRSELLKKSPGKTPTDAKASKRDGDREMNVPANSEPSFGSRLSHLFSASHTASSNAEQVQHSDMEDEDEEEADEGEENQDDEGGEIDGEEEANSDDSKDDESQLSYSAKTQNPQVEEKKKPQISPSPSRDGNLDSGDELDDEEIRGVQESTRLAKAARDSEPTLDLQERSLKSSTKRKDATLHTVQNLRLDEATIASRMANWVNLIPSRDTTSSSSMEVADLAAADAEEKLSLIISKNDFFKMKIAGQFNLGFVIAVRPGNSNNSRNRDTKNDDEAGGTVHDDELFIIDQHATDEKYNFERLQATTVVQSQRLVHPKRLELTALEEEIVLQNMEAIEANGFKVDIDMSGDEPVGSRCQLLSLPLSRETVFDLSDLEELISLLSDQPAESKHTPRPSKVRKMFAMRACRSSIMIGKALTQGQMENLVRHMGDLDKPWNCPHGRPTMRHLCKLKSWDNRGWKGDVDSGPANMWRSYITDDE